VAKDGLSGLAAFERMKPALVLVEAMLPRKHGFEVCQEIKATLGGKSTPVLITSAVCRGRKYRMDALQIYGCDEYVEKPIPDDELLSMIGRLIEESARATEDVKQNLAEAIDTLADDAPAAIDSMSDDELEAKIDSLLMSDEPAAAEPVVETVAVVEPADPETPAFDATSELERRVEAMVQVDSAPIDTPMIDPLPAADDGTGADPFGDVEQAARTETTVSEWAETATPPKGGSKAILFGMAAVVVLGAVGFLAFQQGWIGRSVETGAAKPAAVAEPPAVAEPTPVVAKETEVADTTLESAPPKVDPEPVKIARQAEPRPELPPEPKEFQGRSPEEKAAAAQRQRAAEQALAAAAGSLQSELLTPEFAEPLTIGEKQAPPVDVEMNLIGTPEPPKPRRGQLFDIDDVDTSPRPKEFAQPVYDEVARRMHQQGEVRVSVLIDENGKVVEVELVKSIPNSRLNNSTLQAAKNWVYEPATKSGVPVSVWKTERILFSLD
jgi:TonB family protein